MWYRKGIVEYLSEVLERAREGSYSAEVLRSDCAG